MIDTVELAMETDPIKGVEESPWSSHFSTYHTKYGQEKHYESYVIGSRSRKSNVLIQYNVKPDENEPPKLTISVASVPKLFIGHNAIDLDSNQTAIYYINREINKYQGLENIDVSNGILNRIDLCHNYYTVNLVEDYLSVIATLNYPKRSRMIFKNNSRYANGENLKGNGVTFFSERDHTTFYNKYLQSGRPEARNLLRHERSLKSLTTIIGATNLTTPTLAALNWDIAYKILSDDLETLNLNKPIPGKMTALEMIIKQQAGVKGLNAYKNYLLVREHPDISHQELANLFNIDRTTIKNMKNKLKNVGICAPLGKYDDKNLLALHLPIRARSLSEELEAMMRRKLQQPSYLRNHRNVKP